MTNERELLHEIENILRDFISEMLQRKYGITWVDLPQFEKLKEKWLSFKTTKNGRRIGGFEESRLIYFSNMGDLKELILSNWDIFKPCFRKEQFLATRLDELTPIRDAVAHRRSLSETEKGRVKQYHDDIEEVVREYKRKTAKIQDFVFPTIMTVQDSLGNIQTNSWAKNSTGEWPGPSGRRPIVHVSDHIEFIAKAFDPEGKLLDCRFSVQPMGGCFEILRDWGTQNSWVWLVQKRYVGPWIVVKVDVRSKKDIHWMGEVDDYTYLQYTVLPMHEAKPEIHVIVEGDILKSFDESFSALQQATEPNTKAMMLDEFQPKLHRVCYDFGWTDRVRSRITRVLGYIPKKLSDDLHIDQYLHYLGLIIHGHGEHVLPLVREKFLPELENLYDDPKFEINSGVLRRLQELHEYSEDYMMKLIDDAGSVRWSDGRFVVLRHHIEFHELKARNKQAYLRVLRYLRRMMNEAERGEDLKTYDRFEKLYKLAKP